MGLTMTFPDSQDLLGLPQFWIADTAASVHMLPHKMGMYNWMEAKQAISMGNKSVERTSHVADIKGTICNNNGIMVSRTKLTQVAHLPKMGFNLFSCTKMQKKGWKLSGDNKNIMLTKGQSKIVFDIPISTMNGQTAKPGR